MRHFQFSNDRRLFGGDRMKLNCAILLFFINNLFEKPQSQKYKKKKKREIPFKRRNKKFKFSLLKICLFRVFVFVFVFIFVFADEIHFLKKSL